MRKGYTIVEVSLVLAVSGLLLVGLIAGLSSSIAQQRYNDTVQDFAEYLRAVYGRVESPQGADDSGGDGDEAYYGRMILFGKSQYEPYDPMMCDYEVYADADLDIDDSNDTLSALKASNSGVTYASDTRICHTLPWDGEVQNASGELFAGAVLILRSPVDDVVHTYVATGDGWKVNGKEGYKGVTNYSVTGMSFYPDEDATGANAQLVCNLIGGSSSCQGSRNGQLVQVEDADFCIDSEDLSAAGGIRRDVRLAADGNNASAVELIDVNSSDNRCDG